jgi:hypothetical protein
MATCSDEHLNITGQLTKRAPIVSFMFCYPGADASFTPFSDDNTIYADEKGAGSITRLHWDDAKQMLTHHGAAS